MAIKTSVQGSLPAINLDYLQYNQFNMTIQEHSPHTISLSGKLRAYGVDSGVKYYAKDHLPAMTITNLDAYVATKVAADRQAEALAALAKVQEGLGVLASIYYGFDFVGVE